MITKIDIEHSNGNKEETTINYEKTINSGELSVAVLKKLQSDDEFLEGFIKYKNELSNAFTELIAYALPAIIDVATDIIVEEENNEK